MNLFLLLYLYETSDKNIMSVLGNFEQANVPKIPEQKKDPNKPKRARSARDFFYLNNRGPIRKENPTCNTDEVTKIQDMFQKI
jgi:hypothetical protein